MHWFVETTKPTRLTGRCVFFTKISAKGRYQCFISVCSKERVLNQNRAGSARLGLWGFIFKGIFAIIKYKFTEKLAGICIP